MVLMSTQKVVAPPAVASMFLVLTVKQGRENHVRETLGDLAELNRAVSFRVPHSNPLTVAGIGSDLWDRMLPDLPRPKKLHPFIELDGGKHKAPATPGDLLLQYRADRHDLCFEAARIMLNAFGDAVDVVDETHGFTYFDQRDLLGFVDGTENPEDNVAHIAAKVSAADDPEFAGGSYVHIQKYTHDLSAWNELSTEEQEAAIGRTKLDDVELKDKPSNSHVALNDLDDDDEGNAREILRQNMAFGSFGDKEFGTYFIGYSRDPEITEEMLRHMFIGNPPGNYDRILDFSTAITGGLFFVPPVEMLDDIAD